MDVQIEEQVTYYITMDKHDVLAARKMLQVWYDGTANSGWITIIELGILDAFGVEY